MDRRQARNIKYINKQHRDLERNYKRVLVDYVNHLSMIFNTLNNIENRGVLEESLNFNTFS